MKDEKQNVASASKDEFGGMSLGGDEFGSMGVAVDEFGGMSIKNAPPPPVATESVIVDEGDSGAPKAPKAAQEAIQAPQRASESPTLKKRARKPFTKREKAVRVMLRRAGVERLPTLEHLMRSKNGKQMAICDIGLFGPEPRDAALKEIADKCPVPNRACLSAEITRNRVVTVGAEILKKGRMFQPIQVARIEEDGAYECTSGRCRLAFLAMAYGPKAEVPVYIEDMSLNEARDAVVVANQARPIKALERAEQAIMKAVSGDAKAAQDELYDSTVTTKAKAKKYAIYSVVKRDYPEPLAFSVSLRSSRKDGCLTTLTNVENFWAMALDWQKGMTRAEFDGILKKSIVFLNSLVGHMKKQPSFDSIEHLAAHVMYAAGKFYHAYCAEGDPTGVAEEAARQIVGMRGIDEKKADEICDVLTRVVRS